MQPFEVIHQLGSEVKVFVYILQRTAKLYCQVDKSNIMRRIPFLFFLTFVISCNKPSQERRLEREIVGTWEFERFIGYPFNQPTLPRGNGHLIIIGENGNFERKQHDTLLFKGNYSIQRKKDCYERPTDIIFSTNENSSGGYQYVETLDGKLTFSTPNCYQDGGTAYYRKVE